MSYWRLIFHDGPWDGQVLESDREPVRIELCAASKDRSSAYPNAYTLWEYTPGIVKGDTVEMVGKHLERG